MHKQRGAVLIFAVIGVLGTFMPWVNYPYFGAGRGIGEDGGWITLFLFAVPLVISLAGNRTASIPPVAAVFARAAALIAGGIGVYKIAEFDRRRHSYANNTFGKLIASSMSLSYGLYFVAVAGIAIIICSFALKD